MTLTTGAAPADLHEVKIALLLAAGASVGLLAVRHERAARLERRLGQAASVLAGRSVRVHCQSLAGELLDPGAEAGTVQFDADGRPADRTDLDRSICGALRRFPRDVATPRFDCMVRDLPCPRGIDDEAFAVHTLAHEAWHLRGVLDEAQTECLAIQTTARAAVVLGAPPLRAAAVERFVFEHVYPRMPDEYRSPDCRDEGPWDLRPNVTAWP